MDLTPLLSMIPPPWNLVAIFGLGVLAKWIHGRNKPAPAPAPVDPSKPAPAPVPLPGPSNTPVRDWLREMLLKLLSGVAPAPASPQEAVFGAKASADLTPEQALAIYNSVKSIHG